MSTYAELETRCKRRLGRRGMTITTEFLDEMQAAQELLEEGPSLPKFLKTDDAKATAADTSTLTDLPPADFIRVYDDAALTWVNAEGATQRAKRLDTYAQLISKINNGIPEGSIYYYIDEIDGSEIIRINPQSTGFTFTLAYYGTDTVLTGSNDNLWTTKAQASLIMATAGIELAIWLRDDRALKYFQGLEARERARMIRAIEADEWGDTDLVMGDRD